MMTLGDTRAHFIARIAWVYAAIVKRFGATLDGTTFEQRMILLASKLDLHEGKLARMLRNSPDLKAAIDAMDGAQ